jgi:hypothetical protein
MSVKKIADVHDAQLVCIEYLPEKSIRIDFLKVDNNKKSLEMTGVKFFFCNQLLEGNTVLSVDVLGTEDISKKIWLTLSSTRGAANRLTA